MDLTVKSTTTKLIYSFVSVKVTTKNFNCRLIHRRVDFQSNLIYRIVIVAATANKSDFESKRYGNYDFT